MILLHALLAAIIVLQCGGKKSKKSEKAPLKPPKAPVSKSAEIAAAAQFNEVAVKKEEVPAGKPPPPKAVTPPKPAVPDTKVAEMMPDSPQKSDEMKEGIKLPNCKNMQTEGDHEMNKELEAKKEEEKKKKHKKSDEIL